MDDVAGPRAGERVGKTIIAVGVWTKSDAISIENTCPTVFPRILKFHLISYSESGDTFDVNSI